MNEPKWTPGPWTQSHRPGKDGMYRTQVYDSAGETIATLDWHKAPGSPKGTIRTDRDANARLIAIAPELYQQLRIARDSFVALFDVSADSPMIREMDATLAKALRTSPGSVGTGVESQDVK